MREDKSGDDEDGEDELSCVIGGEREGDAVQMIVQYKCLRKQTSDMSPMQAVTKYDKMRSEKKATVTSILRYTEVYSKNYGQQSCKNENKITRIARTSHQGGSR